MRRNVTAGSCSSWNMWTVGKISWSFATYGSLGGFILRREGPLHGFSLLDPTPGWATGTRNTWRNAFAAAELLLRPFYSTKATWPASATSTLTKRFGGRNCLLFGSAGTLTGRKSAGWPPRSARDSGKEFVVWGVPSLTSSTSRAGPGLFKRHSRSMAGGARNACDAGAQSLGSSLPGEARRSAQVVSTKENSRRGRCPRDRKNSEPRVHSLCIFNGSHFVPASLYSATIYLRVSSAGPLVSSSDAASELSGLWCHCTSLSM